MKTFLFIIIYMLCICPSIGRYDNNVENQVLALKEKRELYSDLLILTNQTIDGVSLADCAEKMLYLERQNIRIEFKLSNAYKKAVMLDGALKKALLMAIYRNDASKNAYRLFEQNEKVSSDSIQIYINNDICWDLNGVSWKNNTINSFKCTSEYLIKIEKNC